MRVVYFSLGYSPHDRRFLAALAGAGLEVHFLRLKGARDGLAGILPEGVRVLRWSGGGETLRFTWAPYVAARLRATLAEVNPDIVHAGPVQDCALPACLAGQRPLVTMSWGYDLLMDGRRGRGQRAAARALEGTTLLFCDCDTVRRTAVDLGMDPDRIVVFPWGVDLRRFRPGRAPAVRRTLGWEKAFIVLTSRAWEPRYGVDTVLEGFSRAAQREPRLRLLMLGDGSLRPSVLSRIAELGLSPHVSLPGAVPEDALLDFYRAADVYLSASHVDGTSVSLLEAMASGLPAVVSDIPANREWVRPQANGWLFPDGDADALAASLLEAVRSRARGGMGRRNRRQVERRADWRRAPKIMIDAYRRAIHLAQEQG